jgi:YggT family protein
VAPDGSAKSAERLLNGLTDPVLAPIRRALPPMGGLDLSPMVLLIVLQFFKRIL